MSEQYPECPLDEHYTCEEIADPRVCAIVREDMACLLKEGRPIKKGRWNLTKRKKRTK